jgi:hypothetical protein
MKENILEMPVKYPKLRNITGSIYQLVLLHEIIRRYYENGMRPFKWSMRDIQEYIGFSEPELQDAIKGINEFVSCSPSVDGLEWVIDMEYTRRILREIYGEQ